MSDKVRDLAEKLLRAEQGPPEFPWTPYGRRSQLSDLWECDQQRFIRMAEAVINQQSTGETK